MDNRKDQQGVLPQRLRQLRLARGLTLEALACALGGLVTKQAISKYEKGRARPSVRVLGAMARALGVKTIELCVPPGVQVEVIAFRKTAKLGRREQGRVENTIRGILEQRVRLQELTGQEGRADIPVHALCADTADDVEAAAVAVRNRWNLGSDPLASVTEILEEHRVHVVEIPAADRLDGLAAVARDSRGAVVGAAVVSKQGLPAERQRFNLAHELAHLVLKPAGRLDGEKAAFGFAGAFLAPASALRREVGERRSVIGLDELLLLKRRYGMSIQALVYRLHDLEVINDLHARHWWQTIGARGWKRQEPGELLPEQPQWLWRTVLRGLSERLLSAGDAAAFLGETIEAELPASLVRRRAFLKLPQEERRKLLSEQAEQAGERYEQDADWREFAVAELTRD